jgi:hypothetical protein
VARRCCAAAIASHAFLIRSFMAAPFISMGAGYARAVSPLFPPGNSLLPACIIVATRKEKITEGSE